MSTGQALAYGTLVVGILDGLDALIFFGLRGAQPTRIFQGIASGLLGRSAFSGGLGTALLGVAIDRHGRLEVELDGERRLVESGEVGFER